MIPDYWQRQQPNTPLFPDIVWQKPEQQSLAGKLLIIGGNTHGFAAVAQAYQDAKNAGAGECRVVLPDALKKAIDPLALDCVYVPTNASGGITKDALPPLKAAAAWADALLFIGDAGRNSENYPRTLLFSMQLTNVVEALHKFTITYPATVVVFHQNQLLVATHGKVSSTPWENPMLIWRGSVAAKAAVYAMQFPAQPFQAITTALAKNLGAH